MASTSFWCRCWGMLVHAWINSCCKLGQIGWLRFQALKYPFEFVPQMRNRTEIMGLSLPCNLVKLWWMFLRLIYDWSSKVAISIAFLKMTISINGSYSHKRMQVIWKDVEVLCCSKLCPQISGDPVYSTKTFPTP